MKMIIAKPFTASSILNKHYPAMFLHHDFWYDFINVAHNRDCECYKENVFTEKNNSSTNCSNTVQPDCQTTDPGLVISVMQSMSSVTPTFPIHYL